MHNSNVNQRALYFIEYALNSSVLTIAQLLCAQNSASYIAVHKKL